MDIPTSMTLTPTQQRIIELLPATPHELAHALYGRAGQAELNLVYAHVSYLRRRLNGDRRIVSHRHPPDEFTSSRIIYRLEEVRPMTTVFYDIETRTWADEHPGGWNDIANFGLALAITWCKCHGGFRAFNHDEATNLYDFLVAHDRVITFNGLRFDNTVVAADAGRPREPLDERTFDILADLHERLGHRVSLDQLAEGTLNRRKTGSGDLAVNLWKAYEMHLTRDPGKAHSYWIRLRFYCLNDVEVTRDIYHFGVEHGYVLYTHQGLTYSVEVNWLEVSQ